MSYKRVTLLTGAAVTDEVIEVSKNKYMPAIKAMGVGWLLMHSQTAPR